MKNSLTLRLIAFVIAGLAITSLYSCKEVHYDVSVAQIDSLLNANGEVHILLPTGTNIELVESGNKQKGENSSPGSNDSYDKGQDVFNGIRKTIGTDIMNAQAQANFQCPPYCEIVLKKPQ